VVTIVAAGSVPAAKLAPVRMARAAPTPFTMSGGRKLPAGYRAAWDDGRLNPNRGPQTTAGDAQMALVWSDDVPARLISK